MASKKGIIALMGSGELTTTMVEVHKELLARVDQPPKAIFLDTPAGFQLNVDQLSERAMEYFRKHVQQHMLLASFKSKESSTELEAEKTLHTLRQANFILIGPGSPTYAVRQWRGTSIPEMITRQVEDGGCLVAASAAALTVGRYTLPVYEIYKVGQDLHWVEGINLLENFGFNLVIIPHWNNAEGGTHDTRFCFMGETRFSKLESMLPEDVSVFGLDEHTACLIDLAKDEAEIKGLGNVTLRRGGEEIVFEKGNRFSLEVLRGGAIGEKVRGKIFQSEAAELGPDSEAESFWDRIHGIQEVFRAGLEQHDSRKTTNALLELDRAIWKGKEDLENEEFISQAREVLRDLIVLFGMKLESSPKNKTECLAPVIEELVSLRQRFRENKKWEEADAIRESLERGDVLIEDTPEGSRWRLKS
ncbi:MAG: Type 1 glutamine amidotransferase-like domain-containing protein [Deltaproteobacteria bacterium]|nr:Type 1 glutamine amidotransferase-like domain-containing protein [Deltaproteobacteria bacterium]